MKQFTCRIQDPNGLHARPAGQLVAVAKRFTSEITVRAGEKSANAKRLLALMGLGAAHNTELTFCIEGADEEEAAIALEVMLRSQNQDGKGDNTNEK